MIDRRSVLLAVAASTMFATVGTANASDWKAKYPELVFAIGEPNLLHLKARSLPLVLLGKTHLYLILIT